MTNDRKHDWQWRPATEADIGRLARFGREEYGFFYGILSRVCERNRIQAFECIYPDGSFGYFYDCEVQYDANEEPL